MKKIDFDNQDLGAVLLATMSAAIAFNYQTIEVLTPGLPGQILTMAFTALIAWVNPGRGKIN